MKLERILFIGNSATYYHDMPVTFSRLIESAGYHAQVDQLTTTIQKSAAQIALA